MPVCPCRCFGLRPSSAIFGLSRQPQQRLLSFRDLLAQVLFLDPVHPRPHPPFSRQPSVVFPSDRLETATSRGTGPPGRSALVDLRIRVFTSDKRVEIPLGPVARSWPGSRRPA